MNLEQDLAHVLWLGGSPCAGKTSVARRLAAAYGLETYHCDERFDDHRRRVDPDRHPSFARLKERSPEDLFLRPVDEMVDELLSFYEEEFAMVVDDLLAMPREGLLVEGAGLLPGRITGRAAWLVATPEFRRRHYPRRGAFVGELLRQCRDPRRAWRNWMERDDRFSDALAAAARETGGAVIRVDGRRTLDETASTVARVLGLAEAP